MVMRVKAKFSDGHIIPLEPLDIEEGAELSVEIDVEPRSSDQERMKRTMSADRGLEGASRPGRAQADALRGTQDGFPDRADALVLCNTAMRHGLTLLTNNRRHFGRLRGLDIISV